MFTTHLIMLLPTSAALTEHVIMPHAKVFVYMPDILALLTLPFCFSDLAVSIQGWLGGARSTCLGFFVAVSFPVSLDGMAAWTGISPLDSQELWLPWEVDLSASPPGLLASLTSLLELALSELSLAWCSSSQGASSSEPAVLSSLVPSPSWDVDLLSPWPSPLDPAGDYGTAAWVQVLGAEWEQDLTRLVP